MPKPYFPKTHQVVQGPGLKWQIEERGSFISGGRCEPYVKTWGDWDTQAKAQAGLVEFMKSKARKK